MRFIKKHLLTIVLIVFCLASLAYCGARLHYDKQQCQVIYDGEHFAIVSYNGTHYIINYDIDGGVHEINYKKYGSTGENKASH